jgi:hypothetical protein
MYSTTVWLIYLFERTTLTWLKRQKYLYFDEHSNIGKQGQNLPEYIEYFAGVLAQGTPTEREGLERLTSLLR